jgi:hypothetical protein
VVSSPTGPTRTTVSLTAIKWRTRPHEGATETPVIVGTAAPLQA